MCSNMSVAYGKNSDFFCEFSVGSIMTYVSGFPLCFVLALHVQVLNPQVPAVHCISATVRQS